MSKEKVGIEKALELLKKEYPKISKEKLEKLEEDLRSITLYKLPEYRKKVYQAKKALEEAFENISSFLSGHENSRDTDEAEFWQQQVKLAHEIVQGIEGGNKNSITPPIKKNTTEKVYGEMLVYHKKVDKSQDKSVFLFDLEVVLVRHITGFCPTKSNDGLFCLLATHVYEELTPNPSGDGGNTAEAFKTRYSRNEPQRTAK